MFYLASIIGKMVVWLSRHLGGGHGSALPGLVVEKLYPKFLARLMAQLPGGVVLVSGTNGKTTTTKIIVDLLRADNYRVFTNPSGSNFTRGVISAALPLMKRGKLSADIAVLELDEAHAVHFVDQVKPRYSLFLNVLRDQLDRFGEIDNTASLLQYSAIKTAKTVILNENDSRTRQIARADGLQASVTWFGYSDKVAHYYKSSDEPQGEQKRNRQHSQSTVLVNDLRDGRVEYLIDGQPYTAKLQLFGIHNALNCAAALSVVRAIEKDAFQPAQAVANLANIKPAFGRGETITVGQSSVRLILVKNPSGFQIGLQSSSNLPTLIAVNDAYADGRDVSWLWDVSFADLVSRDTPVWTTGVRANDMALRLSYDGVSVAQPELNIDEAVASFVDKLDGQSGQIFATYTAMLKIRDQLEKMAQEINYD